MQMLSACERSLRDKTANACNCSVPVRDKPLCRSVIGAKCSRLMQPEIEHPTRLNAVALRDRLRFTGLSKS